MQTPNVLTRNHTGSLQKLRVEDDTEHHLVNPFLPQTPLGSLTPERTSSPVTIRKNGARSFWFRWVTEPSTSIKILVIPVILYINWEALAPYVAPGIPNPFAGVFLISHNLSSSAVGDPRYAKGYLDLIFVAYYIVFFSFVRQIITVNSCRPIARYFGIKRPAKIDRFGEQVYALVYFAVFGAWDVRIMSQLPTWWYRTEYFWIDYPHWDLNPGLKRYYLMQLAYWCQQLIVQVFQLEKPRKDYLEYAAHHFVTLWLIGWSYFMNLTFIGNAVFLSMDIPDAMLAFCKLLNYIQWERAKVVAFGIFVCVWTYFRHFLNVVILWSVWSEFDLAPENARQWKSKDGVYLADWIQHQMLLAIGLLQLLNLFWYYLIIRILVRTVITSKTDDDRSDDEDSEEHDKAD